MITIGTAFFKMIPNIAYTVYALSVILRITTHIISWNRTDRLHTAKEKMCVSCEVRILSVTWNKFT